MRTEGFITSSGGVAEGADLGDALAFVDDVHFCAGTVHKDAADLANIIVDALHASPMLF